MDLEELHKRLAEQYNVIERQRIQIAAQRQVLEDLVAWAGRAAKILKEFP